MFVTHLCVSVGCESYVFCPWPKGARVERLLDGTSPVLVVCGFPGEQLDRREACQDLLKFELRVCPARGKKNTIVVVSKYLLVCVFGFGTELI